ncbi:MAG: regulatory protein GemA [Rhodocyclaceae bacterium]|nr:regulatory protein GemA [Rhodocyclaceae bacterium]
MSIGNDSRGRSAEALRKKEITLIHVLSTQIGLDEETRRGLMSRITGKSSSKDLTWQERKRVIDHLKASGAKVTTPRKAGNPRPAAPSRALDTSAMASKVRALWLALHQLGAVRDSSESALGAYCKRIAKVDALQWADGAQLETLIETLKKWVVRVCRELAPSLMDRVKLVGLPTSVMDDLRIEYLRLTVPGARPAMSCEDAQDFVATLRRLSGQ